MDTILVVDDSPVEQRIIGGYLADLSLEAVYAKNGNEALVMIAENKPAVVLTDLQMPEMDGLELVEILCKEYPEVPVVLMTAFGSEEIAVAALKAGATSYVPKSMLKQELEAALEVVLRKVEAKHYHRQVRAFLSYSESQFVLGYEHSTAALVSYLQEGLEQLNFFNETAMCQITTALGEALTNAIDHGCLELDSALREQPGNLYRNMGDERMKISPYRERHVYVTERLAPDEVTYVIRDDGPGFDPSQLPDPTDPANLLNMSGRGLMLIKTFMDEVSFNDKGNEITMVKRRVE